VAGVLRNLAFMRHSPPQVLEVNPTPLTLARLASSYSIRSTRLHMCMSPEPNVSLAVVPEFCLLCHKMDCQECITTLFTKLQLAQESDKRVSCSHNVRDEDVALLILQVLLQHGRLKMGHKQQPLRSKGEAGGAFVVISGIVRVACESGDGVAFEDAFLGAGLFSLACHTCYDGYKLQVCCLRIHSVV